ncbi:MAG TPA: surface-adhesin E family protein [Burkholderiales bacterium]|nr:surface-adhesin E family protein [Burkholderiales bacterium]
MIYRSLFTAIALSASISANAAPEWTLVAGNVGDQTFLDSSSVEKRGDVVQVEVLRNYDQIITLGNDPVTGDEMYAHRSVKLTYQVDCGKGLIAMSGWKMFEGSHANGDVVWADQTWGNQNFTNTNDDETRSVVRSTCAINTAAR